MSIFWRVHNDFFRQAQHFRVHDWMMLSILVLTIGFLCLRGYGSRAKF
ncbi:MAG TPA: hypothetical protein VGJ26_19570 [Pirellulales bacterium]|jgi:hypothetical protein